MGYDVYKSLPFLLRICGLHIFRDYFEFFSLQMRYLLFLQNSVSPFNFGCVTTKAKYDFISTKKALKVKMS